MNEGTIQTSSLTKVRRSFNSLESSDQFSEMLGRMSLSPRLGLAGKNVVIINGICCGQGTSEHPTSATYRPFPSSNWKVTTHLCNESTRKSIHIQ